MRNKRGRIRLMKNIVVTLIALVFFGGSPMTAFADEKKMVAFNITPDMHSRIHEVVKRHGVNLVEEYSLLNLSLMLYVFEKESDLKMLPSAFDGFDQSQIVSGSITMTPLKVSRTDGVSIPLRLVIMIREWSPETSDADFATGVVNAASAALIAGAKTEDYLAVLESLNSLK
jgi:hypothetical protein